MQNKVRCVLSLNQGPFVGRVLRLRRNTHFQDIVSFDSLFSRAGLGHLGKG